jgi:peptide/nickel transport system ATP-binding protein/oligopeptide transport system ATP-binding protein
LLSNRGVVRAVDDVSFKVMPGEALGVVGESGSGKTTMLRAILGLLPLGSRIVRGQIRFEGRDLAALSRRELRKIRGRAIGMIFQDPMTALNPVMRVVDQIAEGPRRRMGQTGHQSRDSAMRLMAAVGIPDPRRRARAYPHELSGGMRQRVVIAIALAGEPRLLLCDEPTTALDVTIQDQILRLLSKARSGIGAGMVYVTHDLSVIAQTCPRLAVMYAGQLVELGSVQALFSQPRHPYLRGLLESLPDAQQPGRPLRPIAGSPPDLAQPPSGCRFHPRCPYVMPDCVEGDFPLLNLGDDRSTACIHHEALVDLPSPLGDLSDVFATPAN